MIETKWQQAFSSWKWNSNQNHLCIEKTIDMDLWIGEVASVLLDVVSTDAEIEILPNLLEQ